MPLQDRPRALTALAAGAVLLAIVAAAAIVLRTEPIEDDLTAKSIDALEEAGFEAMVSFDGRHGTVTGPFADESSRSRADTLVDGLWGVAGVDTLTVGTAATTTTTTLPAPTTTAATVTTTSTTTTTTTLPPSTTTTTAPPPPAALEVDSDGDAIVLGGLVGSDAEAAALVAAFENAFAGREIRSELEVGGDVDGGDWIQGLGDAVPALRGVFGLGLRVSGGDVTITGDVASSESRDSVVAALEAAGLTVEDQLQLAAPPDPDDAADLENELNAAEFAPDVLFATGSTEVAPDANAYLDRIAEILIANPGARVEIGGHTDSIGEPADNVILSQARADSVMAYLVAAGVDPVQLTAVGYGETQPIGDNNTIEGQALNRRIEFTVEGSE